MDSNRAKNQDCYLILYTNASVKILSNNLNYDT